MKAILSVCLVLMVCATPATSWGWRRRRGRTQADVRYEGTRDNGVLSGSVTHRGDNWQGTVGGRIDSRGNWGVEAGASWQFRKRSIGYNGKHYTVSLNPCFFEFYDLNNDGVFVKEEMYAIFGENSSSDELFESLDITTDDGQLDELEFNTMAEVTIDGCQKEEEA